MSIMGAICNAKDLLVGLHDAELKTQLQSLLLDAQGEALELQEQVARLQQENAELRKRMESEEEAKRREREDLYLERGVWWQRGERQTQAYCPGCWVKRQALVPLTDAVVAGRPLGGRCPICKASFSRIYCSGRPNPPALSSEPA